MPTGGYLENEAGRPTDPGARLPGFRERLHASFRRRADALFEHTDAILMSGPIPSLPHLSLAAARRRSWCSLYAALGKGRTEEQALKGLLSYQHPGDGGRTRVYDVDVSSWPRWMPAA
jgi:hypothetical protein